MKIEIKKTPRPIATHRTYPFGQQCVHWGCLEWTQPGEVECCKHKNGFKRYVLPSSPTGELR